MAQAARPAERERSADHRLDRALLLTASVCIVAAVALGVALRNNTAGIPLDRWFQRLSAGLSAGPDQPDFHYRSFWLLTRSLRLGRPPGVLYVAALASILMATMASRWSARILNALTPFVALGLAGSAAEWVLKNVIDRRMVGNLGVQTYPSGHSVGTAAIAACVVVALVRCRTTGPAIWRRPLVRRLVAAIFILLSLALGLAMAILRSHFLTDVLGGWLLGTGVGALTCLTARQLERLVHRA